jgi:hypothetical protein
MEPSEGASDLRSCVLATRLPRRLPPAAARLEPLADRLRQAALEEHISDAARLTAAQAPGDPRGGPAHRIVGLAAERFGTLDVFGQPRRVLGGGEHLASVLWTDCDGEDAVAALTAFEPAPAIVIGSGTGSNCHAYWPLIEPLPRDEVERANRRLAHALGADPASADCARILPVHPSSGASVCDVVGTTAFRCQGGGHFRFRRRADRRGAESPAASAATP